MQNIRERIVTGIGLFLMTILIPLVLTALLYKIPEPEAIRRKSKCLEEKLIIETSGEDGRITLKQYMVGILAGEIPADYAAEAIKAQSVIIRTNVYKNVLEKGKTGKTVYKENEFDFSYVSKSDRKKMWGSEKWERNEKKFEAAFSDTEDEILLYNGECIDALFHQVSIGETVSAKELYGKDIPYLSAADSHADVEAKDYLSVIFFSKEELENKFGIAEMDNIAVKESTIHGYVKKVTVNDTILDGDIVREKLSLPSNNYYFEEKKKGYRVVALGKGHGLGLSLYGANEMAQKKTNYKEILKYYYKGVEIGQIENQK